MISTIWERLIFHRISIIVVCRASISAILHTPDFLAFQICFDSVTSKFHCSTSSLSFGFYNVWTFFNKQGQVSENQSEAAKSPRSARILFSENLSSAHASIIYVLLCNLNIAIALLVTLMTKTNMTTLTMTTMTMTAMTIIGCNL